MPRRLLAARLALLLPLAGCSAGAQEAPNNAAEMVASDVLDNIVDGSLEPLVVDARLRAMEPDGWHRIALYANWDFVNDAVWQWIAEQRDCDRATALAIFWKASPDYYLRYPSRAAVPPGERAHYDLITRIRDRWITGGYRRAELAFDPAEDVAPVDFAGLGLRYGDRVARWIPPSMRAPLRGRRIADGGEPLPGVFGPEPEYSGNTM